MGLPPLLVVAKISAKRLLAPGAVDGVRDGGKGRNGLVFAGVAQELVQRQNGAHSTGNTQISEKTYQSESSVASHAVSRDAHAAGVELREGGKDCLGQLLGDVSVHVVTIVVGGLGRVDVEAGPGAKVPGVVLALDIETTYIRRQLGIFYARDGCGYVRGLVSG